MIYICINKVKQLKEQLNLSPNQTAIALLIGPHYRFARHLVLLVGLLLLILSTEAIKGNVNSFSYGRSVCIYIGFIIMLYTNIYLLVPLFFFTGKYLLYFILLTTIVYLVLLLISLILNQYFTNIISDVPAFPISHHQEELGLYTGGLVCIMIILVSTAFKLFGRWITDRKKMSEMDNIALNLELDGLRNQINPHFLFNMLNNVKALIRINPEKATAVIMKLSEFLRYQLYDNKGIPASLQKELDFIFNLAELEKIRREKPKYKNSSRYCTGIGDRN